MELQDSLTLERYKVAIERQRYFTAVSRDAFATFAKFTAAIAAASLTIVSARESLGLDRELVPDMLAVLAYLLTFLGAVTVVQVGVAMVRGRRARRVEAELNPETPRQHMLWWMAEALYLAVVVAAVVIGWRALEQLARGVARTGGA